MDTQPPEVDRLANRLVVANASVFERQDLEAYEREILSNEEATEHDASRFLEKVPKFLFLGQGDTLRREVVLYDKSGEPVYRTDFFRNRLASPNWDIIELKSPQKPFTRGKRGHVLLSSAVNDAIGQAQDYRDYLIENEAAKSRLLAAGIRVCRPRLLVVVGQRGEDVPLDRIEVLRDRAAAGPIEALSYSDLFDFAKALYRSTRVIMLPVNAAPQAVPVDFTSARLSLLDYPQDFDEFGEITIADIRKARDRWEASLATGIPNVRRIQMGHRELYFYLGSDADLRTVFGGHLELLGSRGGQDMLLLPLGLKRSFGVQFNVGAPRDRRL